MKAAYFETTGTPDVIKVGDLPTPEPMAGEVRAVCDPDNRQAEFAIQVAGPWQGRGLGKVLMAKLLRYLRERGTQEVVGQCLLENAGMAALAKRCGFEVRAEGDGLVAMRLALRP